MALAEALARGIPVVSTTAGAIPDTVPAGAGLLAPPGDAPAVAAALRNVMSEPELRARLRAGAQAARRCLSGWDDATRAFAAAVADLAGSAG
jgi:glycosyltransferase involved in cell wall biosynthesis